MLLLICEGAFLFLYQVDGGSMLKQGANKLGYLIIIYNYLDHSAPDAIRAKRCLDVDHLYVQLPVLETALTEQARALLSVANHKGKFPVAIFVYPKPDVEIVEYLELYDASAHAVRSVYVAAHGERVGVLPNEIAHLPNARYIIPTTYNEGIAFREALQSCLPLRDTDGLLVVSEVQPRSEFLELISEYLPIMDDETVYDSVELIQETESVRSESIGA